MKGAVFNGFELFVLQNYGLLQWQQLIDSCDLKSGGIYLATGFYDDNELVNMIQVLSQSTAMSFENILRNFGEFLFPILHNMIKESLPAEADLFDFLISVDATIHNQVQRSDPQAYTPSIFHDKIDENTLLLRYVSHRKMCFFAEGLILGAANLLKTQIKISQDFCCHHGAKECMIRIER